MKRYLSLDLIHDEPQQFGQIDVRHTGGSVDTGCFQARQNIAGSFFYAHTVFVSAELSTPLSIKT